MIKCRFFPPLAALLLVVSATGLAGARAEAAERLCDPAFQNCRTQLLTLIQQERVGIDVAFWFMEDARYANEIIKRWNAGVPVRVIVDTRANSTYPLNSQILSTLRSAGIPMRRKTSSGILHWKAMLFAGQNVVEFSGANYSDNAFVPVTPYVNYVDEAIYYTDDPSVVNSFLTKFDDLWTNTSGYANYANVTSLARHYPTMTKDPELNFPPKESFASRSVGRYKAETQGIDVIMYRVTDRRHSDAMLAAEARGVPVRLITETKEYRDVNRLWHAWNIDRMHAGGVAVRVRAHAGLNHQKSVLLHSQRMTIFGSSNWTSPSSDSQEEHNYFTTKSWFYQWFVDQFERKWNNLTGNAETQPFVPLPPDKPVNLSPSNGATGQSTTKTLTWHGGPWAHVYDVYFGTNPTPPLFAANLALGPSTSSSVNQKFTPPTLQGGTTYYWRIVSKTAAGKTAAGPVWSFTTTGSAPPPPPPPSSASTVVIWASNVTTLAGNWRKISDSSAAGGVSLHNPNQGAAKISPALASPASYFQVSFPAEAGVAYHVWLRIRAEGNSTSNDSVHIQFNDSVNSSGTAIYRIGSTSSGEVVLENGSGAGISGWGWEDNGWGVLGSHVYFASTGSHTLRVQQREDGAVIDQIVISPNTYLTSRPGSLKNDSTILPSTLGGGSPPPAPPPSNAPTVVAWAADVPSSGLAGAWQKIADASAAGGTAIWNPNRNAAKVAPALASPGSYFEVSVSVTTGIPYHVWLRMRAEGDHYDNDSVHVQFSGSTDSGGTARYRIGTTSSLEVLLEEGRGAGVQGWGWNDNGWGNLGPHVYFASSTQRIRVQPREDGAVIDQIVLSPSTYLTSRPGSTKSDRTILPSTIGGGGTASSTVVRWLGKAPATSIAGDWQAVADQRAAGGTALWNPNRSRGKVDPALAAPATFVELSANVTTGIPYHLWLRMRAEGDDYANDSVHVQFSSATDTGGAARYRLGTADSMEVVLENGHGAGVHGWGWNDNGWGQVGEHVVFTSSAQVVRIQQREDGVVIDQMILSPDTYLTRSPGAFKDDTVILAETGTGTGT